jgi:exopolysaccharide production protein ExoZ
MKTYIGVQTLRALGALMVVVFHATNAVRDRIDATAWQFNDGNNGMAGVDLFFVISGFIMVVATHHHWGKTGVALTFLKRRLIRIIPLYWLATSMKLALVLIVPSMALGGGLQLWHTIASYLFIPAWNAKGENFPLLVPGWTLSFEIFFYLWFSIALWLRVHPLRMLTPIFAAMSLFWVLNQPFENAVMILFDSRILEFCLGMGVGLLAVKGRLLVDAAARALALLALVLLLVSNNLVGAYWGNYPLLMWGVPSALLLYAVASLEHKKSIWHLSAFQRLGDASYAIYLFHPFVVSAIVIVLAKLQLGTTVSLVLACGGALVASAIAGLFIHRYFEKPVLGYLRRKMAV